MKGAAAGLLALLAVALAGTGTARADVSISARVSRSSFEVGGTTTLEVHISGATAGIQEPEVDVPDGLEILGSGRSQSFSWINGRSSAETVYRIEIGANTAGRFRLGPIRVRIGSQMYESPATDVTVTAAATRIGNVPGSAGGAASLILDVTPPEPYVGQPVLLRVRLVQRTALVEDPQYTPPATPGFWSEKFRDPESYYADEGNRRVLVTETRARLYPLGAGRQTIGEASAVLALPTGSAGDPFGIFGGVPSRREVVVRSSQRDVRVRPLPGGAPAAFDGAVGTLDVSFSADRARTAQDVPFTVRLDVRGVGNLPLVRTPAFDAGGAEVFPATVEDSLGVPGDLTTGRRSFQWTVLARRPGKMRIPPPAFTWFDPERGAYVTAQLPPLSIEVGPALFAGDEGREAFPPAFARNPLDPGARPPRPWAWGLAGLLVGAAVAILASLRAPRPDAGVRAERDEWLRAVGLARGRDFWQAADGAATWLAAHGAPALALRRDVDAARYGGAGAADPGTLRPRLVEQLGRALPPAPPRWPLTLAAAALVIAAVALGFLLGPRAGEPRDRAEALRADAGARTGDLDRATATWQSLWRRGNRAPGLAARLAWSEILDGDIGRAAAWSLRSSREEARDPAADWVRERVREGGGLVGAGFTRVPLRNLEWAAAALIAGVLAGFLWPRRGPASAALAACLVLALWPEAELRWIDRRPRAVVLRSVALEGPDLQLEPGQVVIALGRRGDRVEVRAARDLVGTLPAASIEPVGEAH